MTVEFGTLICDDYGSKCDCCQRVVRHTKRSLWSRGDAMCFACFSVWYDGGPEFTTAETISAFVRKAEIEGTYPFPCPQAETLPS